MKCAGGKKSIPINKQLYNTTKNTIKRRSRVWPSAYASGQLVRAYKSKGGKYRCAKFGSLDRWFKEKWVNVCKPLGNGKYQTCGRKSSSWKNYPYCRPLRKVNRHTPRTVGELSKSTIKAMCRKKSKNPRKKIFQFGENKNESKDYNMNKQPTCGFGKCNCNKADCKTCFGSRRRSRFGNNLGPTNSNLDTFYKNGTANHLNLRDSAMDCLSGNYSRSLTSFGKKQFIQQAVKTMKRKGTTGSFTRWCKRHGFPKVTTGCIKMGKRNKSLKIRRRAVFAQNIRSKRRNYTFGNKLEIYRKLSLSKLMNEHNYAQERYDKLSRGKNDEQIYLANLYKKETLDPIESVLKEKTVRQLKRRETAGKFNFGGNEFKKLKLIKLDISYFLSV